MTKRVDLDDLPERDRKQWRSILAADTLRALDGLTSTQPDTYCYSVSCIEPYVDVQIPEQHLPEKVRSLLERTLEED